MSIEPEICEECGEEVYPRDFCICDDLVEVERRIEMNSLLALRFDVASYDDYFLEDTP